MIRSFIATVLGIWIATASAGAQIHYPDFSSLNGITTIGDAHQSGNVLRLTRDTDHRSGAAWSHYKQFVRDGFATVFRFRIDRTGGALDSSGAFGGDGFAFVLQNANDLVPNARGGDGDSIGYGGINNSLAIEFDTWDNGARNGDPDGAHLSVHTGGRAPNSDRYTYSLGSTSIPAIDDGAPHIVLLRYRPGTLDIYLDACTGTPTLSVPLHLDDTLRLDNGTAWVGFTASTGAAWETHDILSWTFSDDGTESHDTVTFCREGQVRLSAPEGYDRYEWSTGATTEEITVGTSGTYSVTASLQDTTIDDIECRLSITATRHFTVIEERNPDARIRVEGATRLCPGSSVRLHAESGNGSLSGATFEWSGGERSPAITVDEPGTYFVIVRLPGGCVDTSAAVTITSGSSLNPRITSSAVPILCTGETIVLDAGGGYATYHWSTGAVSRTITVNDPGTYQVAVTDEAGCSGEDSIRVEQRNPPAPRSTVGETLTLCMGEEEIIGVEGTFAAYRWSTGETEASISVTEAGLYWVDVTDENGCTGRSDTTEVIVTELPRPRIQPADTIRLCLGAEATLDVGAGYAGYRWSNGENGRTLVVTATGSYWVEVTDERGCTGRSDTVTVLPGTALEPNITVEGSTTLCSGDSVRLVASPGFASYRWSDGTTGPARIVTEPGDYVVRATDADGCTAASEPVRITVTAPPAPEIASDGPPSLCDGESLRLSVTETFTGYRWSTNETSRSITVQAPGTYSVDVTNADGCRGSASITVDRAASPSLTVAGAGAICGGDSVQLVASGAETYQWTPAEGLGCTNCPDPRAAPDRTTTYRVTAVGGNGCTASADVTVVVLPEPMQAELSIPRDLRISPGALLRVPVLLNLPLDPFRIDAFGLRLRYPERLMRYEGVMLNGTGTEGWAAQVDPGVPGSITASLTAPVGEFLRGNGVVLILEFRTFLGDTLGADLPFDILLSETQCLELTTISGHVELDSLCGLTFRLIEATDVSYALDGNRPNPFNPSTEITFSIGLDGPTRLEILDAGGRRVAILLNEHLKAGRYSSSWNGAGYPSGLYFYRLTSGHWSRTAPMTLVK